MQANDLEKGVVERLLADRTTNPSRPLVRWESVKVKKRAMTGAGFLTEFEPSPELKAFGDGVSLRWGNVGARLGGTAVETGYLVYVDGGCITAVEGYTYGDEWPKTVESIEWYELREGEQLAHPPKVDPA
jgi:hypothetical protein